MGFPGFSLHLGDLLDLSMSNFTRISLGVWDFDPKLKKLEILGHLAPYRQILQRSTRYFKAYIQAYTVERQQCYKQRNLFEAFSPKYFWAHWRLNYWSDQKKLHRC